MNSQNQLSMVRRRAQSLIKSGLTSSDAYTQAWDEVKGYHDSNKQVKTAYSKISEKQESYNAKTSPRVCAFVGCKTRVPSNYFLCSQHHKDWQDYLIDQCPQCGRFKDAQYDLCSACYYKRPTSRWTPPADLTQQKPKVEHSKAWEKADKERTHWFVYILKLDNGEFYVGHTGELRERLMEHRDGKTATIKGKTLKLQYFEILAGRKDAELREANLKNIVVSNPRQIRRMIIEFKDFTDELDYE